MTRTRILMSIPNLNGGGAERIALSVAQNLDTDCFDVSVFVHERVGSLLANLDPSLNVVFENEGPYRRHHLLRSLAGNIRLAREADLLVGANEGRASFIALVSARLMGKPLILWLHNDWRRFGRVASWRQRLAIKLYHAADAVIACSDGVAESFVSLVPLANRKIQTIYNGISVDSVIAQSNVPIGEEHEGIFADPVIVSVGRLDYQKGHEFLVSAHAILRKRGIPCRLVLIGDGDLREALEKQATALCVRDSVHFLGFQDNPHRFVRRSKVFALSSRFEGFGLVLAEACACGVPVVSADCPSGPREILDDGKYGILVQPESADSLADGLERVLKDEAEQRRLGALAFERARQFDLSRSLAEWKELILRITARPG